MNSVIRLSAPSDINGNPRRVFILLSGGIIRDSWDEGYEGIQAIPKEYQQYFCGIDFSCTVRKYNELVDLGFTIRKGRLICNRRFVQ